MVGLRRIALALVVLAVTAMVCVGCYVPLALAAEAGEAASEGSGIIERVLASTIEAVAAVASVLLTTLLGFGVSYLRKRTRMIEDESLRSRVDSALDEAERVARDAILATQQTFVEHVKARADDGKLSADEAREALDRAVRYFASHISVASAQTLENVIGSGSLSEWVRDFIEAKLGDQKEQESLAKAVAGVVTNPSGATVGNS